MRFSNLFLLAGFFLTVVARYFEKGLPTAMYLAGLILVVFGLAKSFSEFIEGPGE